MKKQWTKSERFELSKKLDEDLDNFIDSLVQKNVSVSHFIFNYLVSVKNFKH